MIYVAGLHTEPVAGGWHIELPEILGRGKATWECKCVVNNAMCVVLWRCVILLGVWGYGPPEKLFFAL